MSLSIWDNAAQKPGGNEKITRHCESSTWEGGGGGTEGQGIVLYKLGFFFLYNIYCFGSMLIGLGIFYFFARGFAICTSNNNRVLAPQSYWRNRKIMGFHPSLPNPFSPSSPLRDIGKLMDPGDNRPYISLRCFKMHRSGCLLPFVIPLSRALILQWVIPFNV